MHSDTDVLIVGAGPVGLTLALLIANRGHSVAVYERWEAPFPLPRAVAISHDSLRTFQSAGVLADLEPVLAMSWQDQSAEYLDARREVLMRQTMPGIDRSGFPSMSGFNQPDLEAVLGQCCAEHPRVAVYRGWQARSAAQDADGVIMTLDPSDGETTLPGDPIIARTRFVIGCDGANSSVRTMMATEIVDTGFASRWLVVDIKPADEQEWEPEIGQSLDPARPTTIVPSGPGRRRFEIMALPGETAEMLTADETVWRLIGGWGVEPGTAELVRRAVYTFRGRWAETWRDGRLLLAGDAAHQMPPFMGQGFNSGIRDAIALAWRLDLVLARIAPAATLDSYGAERLPHVRQIVEQSVEIGKMICVTDPVAAARRDQTLRLIRDHPEHAPPPPTEWRLGPGILLPGDPHAGYLSLQARVRKEGRTALFDDVMEAAGRFVLLGNAFDPRDALGDEARAIWDDLDGIAVGVGGNSVCCDVDGRYAAWFDRLGAAVVLVRPDFQVYGVAALPVDVDAMVETLARQLELSILVT